MREPKESNKNLLGIINMVNNIPGYKINIQNSLVFLLLNNELSEKKLRKQLI
jgi:hypothetical protein